VNALYLAWALSALVLALVAVLLGRSIHRGWLGIIVDTRGRYSLSQLQIVLWTVLVVSLVSGVFWARLFEGVGGQALEFGIPNELLVVLGISVGSTVVAGAVKQDKDMSRPQFVAATDAAHRPRLSQVFLAEEGAMADKVVDVAKFQNFWFTLLLVAAYVGLAIDAIQAAGSVLNFDELPGFNQAFVALLGVSHAGYLAGKLPSRPGAPDAPSAVPLANVP
jgi:hypothetical protein